MKDSDNINADTRKNIIRRSVQVVSALIIYALLLFLFSGNLYWIYAWLYLGSSILVLAVNFYIFPRELISERGRKKENTEKWDRILSGFLIIPWLLLYVVAGLDNRFGWTGEYDHWIHIAGLMFYFAGSALISWAMVSNIYFSTAVRIQYDRGHVVSTGGPYRYVRHPGYLGMIVSFLATPVIFGTLWALMPAIVTSILFIIRTVFEDKTLHDKLPGYRDYSEKVKYKILPGIW